MGFENGVKGYKKPLVVLGDHAKMPDGITCDLDFTIEGMIPDKSGLGNHATLTGDIQTYIDEHGFICKRKTSTGKIEVPWSPSWLHGHMAIEIIFKLPSNTPTGRLVNREESFRILANSTKKPAGMFKTTTINWGNTINGYSNIADDNIHQAILNFDGVADRLYLDGIGETGVVDTGSVSLAEIQWKQIWIFEDVIGNVYAFRLYDHGLSTEEINNLAKIFKNTYRDG